MAFLDQRLNTDIERGAVGGPSNRGRVKIYTASGALKQVFGWSTPLHEWDVSYGLRSTASFESLRAMWYAVNFAPYEAFRFRDWGDYQASATNSRLLFITGTTWQMQRVYTTGAVSFYRTITRPSSVPAAVIYRTRSAVVTTVTIASVNYTTGVVTIANESTPGDGGHLAGDTYTWAGHFDVPVTFADDNFPQQLEPGRDGPVVVVQSIKLEEVRGL